jgi:polyisoprenoid-binding protein YceI
MEKMMSTKTIGKWMVTAGLLVLGMSLPAQAQKVSKWHIDPDHSSAQFVVRHLGISNVQGEFTKVSGEVELDEKDITKSSVSATIDVNSIDTRNANRDADLKTDHFFDVAKYPTMTFDSKKISQVGDGKLQVSGNLMMHGITHEATFDVDGPTAPINDPWHHQRRGLSAIAKINRKDWGMTYGTTPMSSKGDMMIGDTITIMLDLEIVHE